MADKPYTGPRERVRALDEAHRALRIARRAWRDAADALDETPLDVRDEEYRVHGKAYEAYLGADRAHAVALAAMDDDDWAEWREHLAASGAPPAAEPRGEGIRHG